MRAAFLLELLHHPLVETVPPPIDGEETGRDGGAHRVTANDGRRLTLPSPPR
jgi:hypothetical protein